METMCHYWSYLCDVFRYLQRTVYHFRSGETMAPDSMGWRYVSYLFNLEIKKRDFSFPLLFFYCTTLSSVSSLSFRDNVIDLL